MQVSFKLPFQSHHRVFQSSPLNPAAAAASTDFTRKHLRNLDKLLDKQPPPHQTPISPLQKPPLLNGRLTKNKGRSSSLLETLNLSRIWPQMKAAEEMSPRHLTRLKRLLSTNPQCSPRNTLGSRWLEYHGSNNWAGLLDPLDENLRREVIRYGEFVQAAYHAFHSNPVFSEEELALPRQVALPDTSYKVTASLYSTSSVELPECLDDVAPWLTQRSSWIGYVAVCDDKTEIQRMGRRDILISLRGTSTCLEWAENFRAQMVPLPDDNGQGQPESNCKVECGFMSLFKTRGANVPSLAESVVKEVKRLVELYKGETLSITVTGHSLGSALAILVADELSLLGPNLPPVGVFTFGGPRVGNGAFANRISSKNLKVLRIVNNQDVITKVPARLVDEQVNQKLYSFGVLSVLQNSLPLFSYSHVGTELRLETKMSPYLKPNADVACCHDLEAYLHLVDGYLSPNCPFRTNAKRSLVKLIDEQRPNVKQLYIRKSNSFTLSI